MKWKNLKKERESEFLEHRALSETVISASLNDRSNCPYSGNHRAVFCAAVGDGAKYGLHCGYRK